MEEDHAHVDYVNPYQPVSAQDLVDIGWCQLSRPLPQKLVPVHRDFWHSAGAPKAIDQLGKEAHIREGVRRWSEIKLQRQSRTGDGG